VYLKAAAALESVGQTQAAAQAYEAAVNRWPDNATAWLGLGNTRYQSGNLQEAEHSYRRAVLVDPGYLAAWNNLAEVLAQRGCVDTAINTLDGALANVCPEVDTVLCRLLEQTRTEIIARQSTAEDTAATAACGQAD
jgi:tetratricopeptide (TPR) repeat protein